MFYEKFTDRARNVMVLANRVAQEWSHEYLGTEHVIVALVRERTNVAAHVLAELRIADAIEPQLAKICPKGPDIVTMGRLPSTPRLKLALDKANGWAAKLRNEYVGAEHLLLGLMDDPDSVAYQVVKFLGASAELVRQRCLEFIGHSKLPEDPPAKVGLRIASIAPVLLAAAEGKWVRVRDGKLEIVEELPGTDTDRLIHVLERIRERAVQFNRPGGSERPAKSATGACSWIVSEIDGVMDQLAGGAA